MFWVDDGCPENGDDPEGEYKPKSSKECLRCCSADGKACNTPGECPGDKWTKDDAETRCAEEGEGYRLCTKEELKSEVCCGTGGSCDSYQIWTSTPQAGKHGP